MDGPRPSIADALEHQDVIWLSSTCPDGRPHVMPMWFVWDGDAITVFSKPHAQKVQNVRFDHRVMVAVGEPGPDFDVELVEAIADLLPMQAPCLLPDTFVRKYGRRLVDDGLTCERYAEVYAQTIRIRPVRWLGWGGRGWADRPAPTSGSRTQTTSTCSDARFQEAVPHTWASDSGSLTG